ncbi:MAG: hypothetical protein ABEI27_13315 [Halobellus sp.]|uniref:hypothetical protein n=1 Tax=Halobellus sp. TaxID=1979212 RepID=UPI0035D407CA
MSISIGEIVRTGYDRTVTRNGLLFAAILFVIAVLDAVFSVGAAQRTVPFNEMGPAGTAPVSDFAGGVPPVSLGLPPAIANPVSWLLGLVSIVVTIAAIRTFVTDETEALPREYFTEDLLWPVINLIVGSIVFGIAVSVGFFLLVVPGLFLLVSLFLWGVLVAVEGDNFVEGFRRSWGLTGGRRLRLLALGVVVIAVALAVSIAFAIPGSVLPGAVGFLFEEVGSALVSVFVLAVVAETYNQLSAAAEGPATKAVIE